MSSLGHEWGFVVTLVHGHPAKELQLYGLQRGSVHVSVPAPLAEHEPQLRHGVENLAEVPRRLTHFPRLFYLSTIETH